MSVRSVHGVVLALFAITGCTSVPSKPVMEFAYAMPKRVDICHGYGCTYRAKLDLGLKDGQRFKAILSQGAASPAAERVAIKKAVRYYEERSYQVTGVRDLPRAAVVGQQKGQMDCIDESSNTDTLLRYLAERGLLKYHKVARKASRGHFIDGRYPHWTAVISDPSGTKWVVDSWYAPMGGAPDIFPYSQWKLRGQFESGALDT